MKKIFRLILIALMLAGCNPEYSQVEIKKGENHEQGTFNTST